MRFPPLASIVALLCPLALSAHSRAPIDVRDHRQLFIDGLFLGRHPRGVRLVVHPPVKTDEETIRPDRPWESGGIGPFCSVLFDGGTYRMWYHAMDSLQWDAGHTNGVICYATSTDGIHWQKPALGLIAYNGSRANNIVMGHGANGVTLGQDGGMVFLDPNAPPAERFRMVGRFGARLPGDTVALFSSGDGIHWTMTNPAVLSARPEAKGHHLDTQNVIFWDDALRRYVAYVRYNRPAPLGRARTIARGESPDLSHFPVVQDMRCVFQPDRRDPTDPSGTPSTDFYNSAAIKYPWADRAYFMFPTAYTHFSPRLPEFTKEHPINAGPLDTVFAASRDGVHWQRYDREPFVPLGMKGEFDWACVRMIWGLVPDTTGRKMYMYYRGGDWLHGWDRNAENKRILSAHGFGATRNITCLSRVVLRRDGFVSVRGAYDGGEFTTPPLTFSGRALLLNVDTSAAGHVRVGILDRDGKPIPGFGVGQCDVIHTSNQINRRVSWRGTSDVHALAGHVVRLRFLVRDADLYAFQFTR